MAFVLKVSNKRQSKQREFRTYYLDQYFLEIVVLGNFSRQNVRVEVSDNFFCRLSFPKSYKTLLHYLHYQLKFCNWSFWTSCSANYRSGPHFCPFHLQIVPPDRSLIIFANCCSEHHFWKFSFRTTLCKLTFHIFFANRC